MLTITDGSLSRFVKQCQDLPGQHLFRWVDADGESAPRHLDATSTPISARRWASDFTAKHFRTWGASVLAFEALAHAPNATSA